MNIDTLIQQYFASDKGVRIDMFDEKNIQTVYHRVVTLLMHQPEVETSLLQGMSYCFYEIMDNVIIHSGKSYGVVISHYSPDGEQIKILVADDGMGIRASLADNTSYKDISEPDALRACLKDKVSDGKGMGFGLYSTSRLIETAGHKLIVRSGDYSLSTNGETTIRQTENWQGTIVCFELRSSQEINPGSVVDHRTNPAEEFNELFLQQGEAGIDKLW